jgi:hypothetical protein
MGQLFCAAMVVLGVALLLARVRLPPEDARLAASPGVAAPIPGDQMEASA